MVQKCTRKCVHIIFCCEDFEYQLFRSISIDMICSVNAKNLPLFINENGWFFMAIYVKVLRQKTAFNSNIITAVQTHRLISVKAASFFQITPQNETAKSFVEMFSISIWLVIWWRTFGEARNRNNYEIYLPSNFYFTKLIRTLEKASHDIYSIESSHMLFPLTLFFALNSHFAGHYSGNP